MYLEEIENIPVLPDSELEELIDSAKDGNISARDRILESHLKFAMRELYDYTGCGYDINDLISEANLALVETLDDFLKRPDRGSLEELRTEFKENIRAALDAFIDDEAQTKAADENLAQQLNDLSDLSVELVQELGRQPTSAELAQKLGVDEDYIDTLLKMSINAL